jgi:hypothetical protein
LESSSFQLARGGHSTEAELARNEALKHRHAEASSANALSHLQSQAKLSQVSFTTAVRHLGHANRVAALLVEEDKERSAVDSVHETLEGLLRGRLLCKQSVRHAQEKLEKQEVLAHNAEKAAAAFRVEVCGWASSEYVAHLRHFVMAPVLGATAFS